MIFVRLNVVHCPLKVLAHIDESWKKLLPGHQFFNLSMTKPSLRSVNIGLCAFKMTSANVTTAQGFLPPNCMPFGSISHANSTFAICRQPCSLMMPDDNDSEQNPASNTSSFSISIQSCQVHYRVRLTIIRKAKNVKSDVVFACKGHHLCLRIHSTMSTRLSVSPHTMKWAARTFYIFFISLSLACLLAGSCLFLPRNPFLRQSLCSNWILFAALTANAELFRSASHHHKFW